METFEAGTTCTWTGHPFRFGEQGMKCCCCPSVMTMEAWDEKRRCRCGSTEVIPAVSSAPDSFNFNFQTTNPEAESIVSNPQTFEAGTTCTWTGHPFRFGEQGMKCCRCLSVMTMEAWDEKRRCRCGSTEVIPAVASATNPSNFQTTNPEQISSTASATNPSNFQITNPERISSTANTKLNAYLVTLLIASFIAPAFYYTLFSSGIILNTIIQKIWTYSYHSSLNSILRDFWNNLMQSLPPS